MDLIALTNKLNTMSYKELSSLSGVKEVVPDNGEFTLILDNGLILKVLEAENEEGEE